MNLKRQLFVASLLMLLIPWAGLQFVLELDDALRQQARQQLQAQAERLAATAGDQIIGTPVVRPGEPAIYVEPFAGNLNLDGYADDWPGYDEANQTRNWQRVTSGKAGETALQWQAATDRRNLYLLIRVSHRQPVFFNPGSPEQAHDRLRLWLEPSGGNLAQESGRQSWLLRTPAPGQLYGLEEKGGQPDYRLSGFLQGAGDGWQLELKLPMPVDRSRLGFAALWGSDQVTGVSTSVDPLPVLVSRNLALERQLEPQLNPGQQARLVEPAGWVIARQQADSAVTAPEFDSLSPVQVIEKISLNALRGLVRLYQPEPTSIETDTNRVDVEALPETSLVRHEDDSVWLLTTREVFGGRTLILEQSLDQLLTLSGSALGSVIARSTLIIVALTLVLLGYASWLSWRITRLQRAVSASIDEDGRITGRVPDARSKDELGQLQRHFSLMVDRLHGYNRYLESFSRRLSHELKTPVAVVRSSLENLNHSDSEEERRQYIERAASATERLRQILHGMSEAARLEQSLDHADKEQFDLAEVAAEATAAYQALDSSHQIRYSGPQAGCKITGSPELMVQLLDKLVDNARDFTPQDGLIEVGLETTSEGLCLSVFNEGSTLPEDTTTDIFSPFVSMRDGQEQGHLGQGLLIVNLIADYHGAHVEARNRAQGGIDGVCFRVMIPAIHS
ncbi:dedicated sortase system histidine kinase [Marinobacter sp. DSM 26671]|uniref:histidine kinase n=3 Tax=Marinobacter TaxID=2742 RepID=A0A3D8H354_9GAMM|nr:MULTISPECIES: ATP-binding protein [Marinobacter]MEC7727295.1 ATP-binding protein [Pseudomonadota bacterium]PHS47351.1 MAG: histidine kinase [Marinobacter sp.]HBX42104.1 histidine kinase [Marinobacter adhaerens]EHJ03297.1 integral membrane sensor signal transduction histidine kinase [Marinobacter manganoxydans MnI7-9]PPI79986.1 histidine kinase [Marinobacter flavimaris]